MINFTKDMHTYYETDTFRVVGNESDINENCGEESSELISIVAPSIVLYIGDWMTTHSAEIIDFCLQKGVDTASGDHYPFAVILPKEYQTKDVDKDIDQQTTVIYVEFSWQPIHNIIIRYITRTSMKGMYKHIMGMSCISPLSLVYNPVANPKGIALPELYHELGDTIAYMWNTYASEYIKLSPTKNCYRIVTTIMSAVENLEKELDENKITGKRREELYTALIRQMDECMNNKFKDARRKKA